MTILIDLFYSALLVLVFPWFAWKSLRTGKYRQGLWMRLTGRVPIRRGERTCIWLHAVSVGEVNLLKTLIDELEQAIPDCECVISSTTETGIQLARRKYAPRSVFFCPFDFSWSVRTALRRIRPNLLVLAELELWPNLITTAHTQQVRVALINGRMSENSYRGYRRTGPLIRWLMRKIDIVAVQSNEYADRFRDLGAPPDSIHVTGSLKFDGANADRNNATTKQLASLARFSDDDIVFLAGSTQEPEEALSLDAFRAVASEHPELRLILVPRHPERFDTVAEMLDQSGLPWQRRSALNHAYSPSQKPRILLVDAVGELWAWWGTAQIAYVGGSMGHRGGQNMIEPAAYGAVVSFGPNTHNFRDIVSVLLGAGAAVVVKDGQQLKHFLRRAIEDREFSQQYGISARRVVASQLGATRRTVDLLLHT